MELRRIRVECERLLRLLGQVECLEDQCSKEAYQLFDAMNDSCEGLSSMTFEAKRDLGNDLKRKSAIVVFHEKCRIQHADDLESALAIVRKEYSAAEYEDAWEPDGKDDQGWEMECLLFWADYRHRATAAFPSIGKIRRVVQATA